MACVLTPWRMSFQVREGGVSSKIFTGIMLGLGFHLANRLFGHLGLLNASFGNAAELIIALIALHAGHIDVVKASITGSIIGNLLLVLDFGNVFSGHLAIDRALAHGLVAGAQTEEFLERP